MFRKITIPFITVALVALLSSPIFAGDAAKDKSAGKTDQMQAASDQAQSAQKMIGMSVVSQQGEDVGEIQDIMLDTQSGRISFVTLSKGGVMGIGGEEGIAVPLEALRFQPQSEQATLTVDKTKLDNAPKQANMSNKDFQQKLEQHYGISPAWERQDDSQQQMHELDQQKKMMKDDMQQMQDEGMMKKEQNKY